MRVEFMIAGMSLSQRLIATKLMKEKQGKTGLIDGIKAFAAALFPAFNESDAQANNIYVQDTPLNGGFGFANSKAENDLDPSETLDNVGLSKDRALRYATFALMSTDSIITDAIDMHLSHALSADSKTGVIVELSAASPEFDDLIDELNSGPMKLINDNIVNWAKLMCTYGVSYIRPYAKEGAGITHFESSFYTLPQFVREYTRSGLLAGYTNQYLRDKKHSGAVQLAPPWALLSLKIPYHTPDPTREPEHYGSAVYSLFDDVFDQMVVETQDYGQSFLETCYGPWRDLVESIDSMRGSRKNASRIDRMMLVPMEGLDPIAAAEYANYIASQLKATQEAQERRTFLQGLRPLITNSLIPVHSGKGQMQIDTNRTDPNISDIEDIMFHLKRLAGSLGIDVSMLGWADLLSGGLGEGGFFQTSIQAARRSAWIRKAATTMINRALDLHMWYRYKKVVPATMAKPWVVEFNSLNSAIAESENEARESRANYSLVVANLVDTIINGSAKKSPALVRELLKGSLDIDGEKLELVLKELLAVAAESEDDLMMSSMGYELAADQLMALNGEKIERLVMERIMKNMLGVEQ